MRCCVALASDVLKTRRTTFEANAKKYKRMLQSFFAEFQMRMTQSHVFILH